MPQVSKASYPAEPLDRNRCTGLIFCGMGGPDGPEAVQPFLKNLFSDPAIMPVPGFLSSLAGSLISMRRGPAARERYRQVSSDSITPQLATTRAQAEVVAQKLSQAGSPCIAAVAMRYWNPYPEEAVNELVRQGAEQFILVPAYPQYSSATTGSTLNSVLQTLETAAPGKSVHVIAQWPTLPGLIDVLAQASIEALENFSRQDLDPESCGLLYVAHSLPLKLILRGDPYLEQTLQTVYAVQEKIKAALSLSPSEQWSFKVHGLCRPLLAFQSRVGPIKWLDPEITETVLQLAKKGCRHLHIQPVSFTCEHVETLLELDVELKETARAAGIRTFSRGQALNLQPAWLESLTFDLQRRVFQPEVLDR